MQRRKMKLIVIFTTSDQNKGKKIDKIRRKKKKVKLEKMKENKSKIEVNQAQVGKSYYHYFDENKGKNE